VVITLIVEIMPNENDFYAFQAIKKCARKIEKNKNKLYLKAYQKNNANMF